MPRPLTVLPSLLLAAALVAGCSQELPESESAVAQPPVDPQTTVFIDADIVTVDESLPGAEALAIRDGRILAVGTRGEVVAAAGDNTTVRDMQGKTVIPGFIDAHGHISLTAMAVGMANVQSPPAGPINSIPELQDALRQWAEDNPDAPWILGWGYDDSLLAEMRHPDRDELDAVSSEKPVFLFHVSGHLVACNSACLAEVGISADSKNPPGGVIRRREGSKEPNGVLEESAVWMVFGAMPQAGPEQGLALLEKAQHYMAAHGITTVQDGAVQDESLAPLQAAAAAGKLYLDVVAFPIFMEGQPMPPGLKASREYRDHFRIGGIKMSLDGSPQGKTAWLTQPYLHPPHGQGEDYVGYPTMTAGSTRALIKQAFAQNLPVLAHANGDAAGDQLIDAVAAATAELGEADRRTVMIHAQTAREDQIDRMQALGMVPSYFVAHTFYWGDWHRDSVFGVERASRISPLKTTADRGMPYTTHNDTPVVPPDMMRLMWAGVNRVTRSGQVLGPDFRVSPLEALKSMTIHAAYQYFEEDRKGSISPGKLADLVVLSANPLKVAPLTIKDIEVLETIKEGETVYLAE